MKNSLALTSVAIRGGVSGHRTLRPNPHYYCLAKGNMPTQVIQE